MTTTVRYIMDGIERVATFEDSPQEAWNFMRSLDAAGITAGFPSVTR
jgi:hypothetical protein